MTKKNNQTGISVSVQGSYYSVGQSTKQLELHRIKVRADINSQKPIDIRKLKTMIEKYLKSILPIFLLLTLMMSGCKKDELTTEYCYEFVTTTTTSVSPQLTGYPQQSTSTTEQCGLTQVEAKQVANGLTSSSTTHSGGYTITVKMSCQYHKK